MKTTKRILSVLLCLALVIGIIPVIAAPYVSAAEQTTVKVTFSTLGYTNGGAFSSYKMDDAITISASKGSGSSAPAYYNTGTALRIYGKNVLTITPAEGATINSVKIVTSTSSSNMIKSGVTLSNCSATGLGTSTVTLTPQDGTAKLSLTNPNSSGHYRIVSIEVTYTSGQTCEHDWKVVHEDGKHIATCQGTCGEVIDNAYTIGYKYDLENHWLACSCGEYAEEASAHVYGEDGYCECGLKQAVYKTFEKITSAPANWEGTYLIVYEAGKVALNSTLTKHDGVGNGVAVEINDGTIIADVDNAFVISVDANGKLSIKSSSGYYIGATSNSNSLLSNASTVYTNTITFDAKGNANIIGSGGAYLRYNNTTNQLRFRYYTSGTYSNQQAIALYKMQEDHTHEYAEVVTDPTCTAAGYTTYTCSCGDTYTANETAALGHTAGEAVKENIVAANCASAGSYDQVVYCTACDAEMSRESFTVDAVGHAYESDVTDPDCVNGGYTTYTCSVCGHSYTSNEVAPLGHTAGTAVKENWTLPTATADGYYDLVVRCTVCGEVISSERVVVKMPNATVSVKDPMVLKPGEYTAYPTNNNTVVRPLQIVMNFKANETLEQALAGEFAKYKVDFYLTLSGLAGDSIVTDGCYLAGNYGTYGWIVIPMDGYTLESDVAYAIVSKYDATLNYKDICKSVKDFTAAIYVDDAILNANPDLKVTLELKMTNPENPEEVLVIGEPAVYDVEALKAGNHTHTAGTAVKENWTLPTATADGYYDLVSYCSGCGEVISSERVVVKMPNATVSVLDPMVLKPGEYTAYPTNNNTVVRPLQIVMNFKANETLEQALAGEFAKYKVDFYLTLTGLAEGSIVTDGCYLAGNYGTYGWIVIPMDGYTLESGVTYPIVSKYDATLNYKDICKSVKDFTAAIYVDDAILNANPDLKVTLELKMTNPENPEEVLVIGEPAVYDVEDLKAGNAYEAQIGDMMYRTLQEALNAAQDGDTIVLLSDVAVSKYLDIFTANNGEIARNITLDLNGYTIAPADDYVAGDYPLVFIGLNQTLNLTDSVGTGKITCNKNVTVGVYGVLNMLGGTIETTGTTDDDVALTFWHWTPGNGYNAEAVGTGSIAGGTVIGGLLNEGAVTITGGTIDFIEMNDADATIESTVELTISTEIEDAKILCENGVYYVHVHSWTDATCTAPISCACGETKGEALGHSYETEVTAPDCENAGYTTHTCANCGHSYTSDEVAALGHKLQVTVEMKLPTCTEDGYTVGLECINCDHKIESEVMKATGHSWSSAYDTECDVCGETRILKDGQLVFTGNVGLSFQDYIGMQALVLNTTAKIYDRIYIEAVQVGPEGTVTTILEGTSWFDAYYLFNHQVLSWSMTEEVTLTLWGVMGDVTFQGQVVTTSVQALANEKLASYSEAGNTKAVTALVDMLNYGAAVQTAFNYNTTSLPTAGDYEGTTSTPAFGATNNVTGDAAVSVLKDSISMQAKVEIQLLFAVDISAYTVKATVGGEDAPVVIDTETMGAYGWTLVRVAVGAAKMRDTYTIALYDAEGNAVTQVYEVSVEAYAQAQLGGDYNDVVVAMMRYGDAVAAL